MPTKAAAVNCGMPHWNGIGTRNQGAFSRFSIEVKDGCSGPKRPTPVQTAATAHAPTIASRIG